MLRMSRRTFQRMRGRLQNAGMPEPLIVGSQMRFPKRPFDAWLNDPRRPAGFAAANDLLPTYFKTIERERDELHAHYSGGKKVDPGA